jgi:hypothetical protein
MKVLVIATLRNDASADRLAPYRGDQAAAVWLAYRNNELREMYSWFKGEQVGGAVFIYETTSAAAAQTLAQALPIVQADLVDLAVYVLEPYTNLQALFAPIGGH